MEVENIKTVGVVGAGTMGHGIAQVFAQAGFEVVLVDQNLDFALKGKIRIQKNLEKSVLKGSLLMEDSERIANRISPFGDLEPLEKAQFIVEAAFESIEAKETLFKKLDRISPLETIFASNTSSLPITKLASFTKRGDRFIGMHFMNPVPIMKLVEVVSGFLTSDDTLNLTLLLCQKLGKVPVPANDFPGFISNRILMPMINEAIFAYMEGVGTKEGIDTVMKLGMNHPMGPLELADFIGLDVCLSILEILNSQFGDPKYRPCPLLRKMVQAGLLGRKTKKGFYDYP